MNLTRHVLLLQTIFLLLAVHPASAQTTGAYRWGINGHPITNGHNMNRTSYTDVPMTTQLDLIAELGAGWYRVGLRPEDFAAQSARFDELLAAAEKRKIRLLPVLLPPQSFWDEKTSLADIRTEAAAFAKTMTSRYKGRITHWELANELDNYALLRKGDISREGRTWSWNEAPEGSSADDYHTVRYQRVKAEIVGLYEGAKAGDSSAITILDTAGWLHFGLIDRLINEDQVTPFDILSWHWYSQMGPITNVQGKRDMVEFLKRYGKPIWMTETNLNSYRPDPEGMADYIRKTVAEMGANPGIECIFLYELLAQPYLDGAEPHYGLVEVQDENGVWKIKGKKPGSGAFREVIKAAGGVTK